MASLPPISSGIGRSIAERLSSLGYEPVLDPEQRSALPAARRALYLKVGVAGFAFGNVMLFSFPEYLGFLSGAD